jgi:hypothetical protein
MLFLQWFTLVPWAIAGLALGYRANRREAVISGAAYGFVLSFVFMAAGYTGDRLLITRVPFFALLGLFGALCGLVLAWVGSRIGRRTTPR